VSCGRIKGWHEKVWTKSDGDKCIKDINNEIGNTDLTAMIKFCCDRWNIELKDDQISLGGL